MNVNGSRFQLLLGEADWGACRVADGQDFPLLAAIWDDPLTVEQRQRVPEWRGDLAAIGIARLPQTLPPTRGESTLRLADRRAVTADRHGNIYVVGDNRTAIVVQNAGLRTTTPFWPDPRGTGAVAADLFADTAAPPPPPELTALVALEGDYLLAATAGGAVLRFDLVGGGEPERFIFPDLAALQIDALAALPDGGALLLDRAARRLYRITADLALCSSTAAAPEPSLFQPGTGAEHREPARHAVWSADLAAVADPVSVAALETDHALVLDHRAGGACGLWLVALSTGTATLLLDCSFDALGMILAPLAGDPGPATSPPRRTALLWSRSGNQAHAVALTLDDGVWEAGEDPELRPMRRFGGRGLVAVGSNAVYDSGEPVRWVPLGTKHLCRFAERSVLQTPVFDSQIYQCQWDRIRIDARIPAGCTIRIEARSFDDAALFAIDPEAGWIAQPLPYANGDRGELPRLALPRIADESAAARQCWDILLQKVTGRHAQLRITLEGDGRQSPMITALRLWYPRFSYARRFLPQVYSQDPVAGDFTDRFLASTEGVNTSIEERIAAARLLIDPRTVPAEALGWLADWFDVALDPAWDERRRRLFIAHAATFFAWRGTLPGLRLALSLAFDPAIDPCDFVLPGSPSGGTSSIRIVEHFRTRSSARPFAAGPASPGIHAVIDRDQLWQPDEGHQGLIERWAWARGLGTASAEEKTAPFSLVAEDFAEPREWAGFMQRQIGFVPGLGAEERSRWHGFLQSRGQTGELPAVPQSAATAQSPEWQAFVAQPQGVRALWRDLLAGRYRTIAQLNAAWDSDWAGFDAIPLPDTLPSRPASLRDWLDFEGALVPINRAAHRFSVLIPRRAAAFDPSAEEQAIRLAQRIIALEKPAHTVFDVRMFWAMNRIGEARLGRDTEIGEGSRAPQLIPPAILGRGFVGASFAGGIQTAPGGRERIAC